jgi:glycosyltransferase involved in cell wall biosynthesis
MDNFSIIIPTFNEAEKLNASLSILFIQLSDLNLNAEIIVIDDSSTDNTGEILTKYIDKIKYFRTERNSGGAGIPRNIGLDNATTNYVLFYDVGDALYLSSTSKIIETMNEMEINLCVSKHIDIGVNDEISHPLASIFNGKNYITDIRKTPQLISNPFCWSKIFKTNWLRENKIKFGDIYCGEDKIFTWTSYLILEKILISKDIMYGHKFYGHDINRMLQRNLQLAQSLLSIDKIMRPKFKSANLLGLYLSRLIKRDIIGIMLNEESIKKMEENCQLQQVLNFLNNWIIDLFIENNIKPTQLLNDNEIHTAQQHLKDFSLLISAESLNQKLSSKELSHYKNYITQLVNMNVKFQGT